MKKIRFLHIGILAAVIMTAPFAVHAQTQTPSGAPHLEATDMSQYPSVFEFKGRAVGGPPDAQFSLRCGDSVSAGQLAPEPTTNDLTLASVGAYTRYQFIDGKPVISTLDAGRAAGEGREVKVQVTEADGTMKAKSCTQNTQTDTLQGCTPTAPFLDAQQVNAMMQALLGECGQFMGQVGSQANPSIYDARKTQAWKAKLSQTLAAVEQ